MNISQAAKAVGLSTKQIRDYEKLGLLGAAKRTAAGYRYYEEMDLGRLAFIRHSRDVGFSLQQIERLQAMVKELQSWHDSCQGDSSPDCPILAGLKGE